MKDLRLETAVVGGRITPSLINGLNATIRRYKPIAGQGIRLVQTTGGTIINATQAVSGGGGASGMTVHPFHVKCVIIKKQKKDGGDGATTKSHFEIYLPEGYDGSSCCTINAPEANGVGLIMYDKEFNSFTRNSDDGVGDDEEILSQTGTEGSALDGWATTEGTELGATLGVDFDVAGAESKSLVGFCWLRSSQKTETSSDTPPSFGCAILLADELEDFAKQFPRVTKDAMTGEAKGNSSSNDAEYFTASFPVADISIEIKVDKETGKVTERNVDITQFAVGSLSFSFDGVGNGTGGGGGDEGGTPSYPPMNPETGAQYIPFDVFSKLPKK